MRSFLIAAVAALAVATVSTPQATAGTSGCQYQEGHLVNCSHTVVGPGISHATGTSRSGRGKHHGSGAGRCPPDSGDCGNYNGVRKGRVGP
jgi:hypothetical protein